MLNTEERERYNRQIMLPGIGEEGQLKLKNASVLVIGVGGLGSPIAMYLCAAGVGKLGLIDNDIVSLSNLQRQILYETNEVGKSKANCAKKRLQKLNPLANIQPLTERITEKNAVDIISMFDIVVDATDNFRSRYLISKYCQQLNKPMVHGAIEEFEGVVSVFNYQGGPVYEDLFPEPPENTSLDGEPKGVFGALPGVIGSIQSMEVLKIITGVGSPMSGILLTYNAFTGATNQIQLS